MPQALRALRALRTLRALRGRLARRPAASARGAVAVGLALGLALISGAGSPAGAHVAASVNDNNRYLKLSLLGDRVRLAYTVFFGEVPGKGMRPGIDRNRDGRLDDAETDAFARRLAAEVAGQLEVTIDGVAAPVRFAQVSFGSVTQAVGGGAFSVDLVAALCMAPAAAHQVRLRDRFALPRPGETEVHLEDGPGVAVTAAAVGQHRAAEGVLRFAGLVPALGEPGLLLEFRAGPDAPAPRDGVCAGGGAGQGAPGIGPGIAPGIGSRRWLLPIGVALIALGGLLALDRRRRRRRRRDSTVSSGSPPPPPDSSSG